MTHLEVASPALDALDASHSRHRAAATLAEHALDTLADVLRLRAEGPDAAAAVETHFKGLVDQAYVARATTALRTALARLYGLYVQARSAR